MSKMIRLMALLMLFVASCATNPDKRTLSDLHRVEPDVAEVRVDDGLDRAMAAYKKFLSEAPESAMTPEAMRRLADLKLEKEYGYVGGGGRSSSAAAAPAPARAVRRDADVLASDQQRTPAPTQGPASARPEEPVDLQGSAALATPEGSPEPVLPGGEQMEWGGPLEAIELYDRILASYPDYAYNDWVLYQKARAFDELGRSDEAIDVIELLVSRYPSSRYIDEVQFRRAEYFFTRKRFLDAEEAYASIVRMGPGSDYYELALYKLGWTLYKQEMHEEALDQYVALLDHKVAIGYDFDQTEDESDERRIADTYRVISLCFSSMGGATSVTEYFARHGERVYESRVYRQLGEYYFEKLRYSDAAESYKAFVQLKPLHEQAPEFSMRVVSIYEAGGFPRLVLESKKEFAGRYGLQSEYWQHFDPAKSPEVLRDLKSNLEDLANHYHALYQSADTPPQERPVHFEEALLWYRAYLASFPAHEDTPGLHYQMADLLLENEDFAIAALEYERTAYDYAPHPQSPAAGYAAIYAHRQAEQRAVEGERMVHTQAAVASTLRFVDAYPEHANAAAVLAAAAQDLYAMQSLVEARRTAQRLVDQFAEADEAIRRSAWAVVANASFDLGELPAAEDAYQKVLQLTPHDDDARQSVVDSLAASIYKQGEAASELGDHRLAAEHFLRIAKVAPDSGIRPVAEYDAGAAFVRLEEWSEAARVFEAFREAHPEHALQRDATRQMAAISREMGDSARAAREYERVAAEAEDPAMRADALLLAGELYEEAGAWDDALAVYLRFTGEFTEPLETVVETRFKMAAIHERRGDTTAHHDELRLIVRLEEGAGDARTPRIRYLAGRSALVLSERLYDEFAAIELVQPFDRSLAKKQRSMDEAIEAFGRLIDYEAAEVTAAATFYMAEIYYEFSRALLDSERPTGLSSDQALEYEDVLEEEAFPFEERAIGVHEKNLELLAAGVFNPWIERSLSKLAELMPGRYAKFEASTGPVASLERYAYERPDAARAPVAVPADESLPVESIDPSDSTEPTSPVPAAPAEVEAPVESAAANPAQGQQAAG